MSLLPVTILGQSSWVMDWQARVRCDYKETLFSLLSRYFDIRTLESGHYTENGILYFRRLVDTREGLK